MKHVDSPPSIKKGKSIKVTHVEAETKIEQKIQMTDVVTIEDASDEEESVQNLNPLIDEDL